MNLNRSPALISIAFVAVSSSLQGVGAEEFAFPPHTFTLPDGYELELAVAPGLVERPMHMYFDEEGALYVTDSSGDSRPAPLQLAEPSHRILRLVDKDDDGVFDESTLFLIRLAQFNGIREDKFILHLAECQFRYNNGNKNLMVVSVNEYAILV